MLKTNYYRTDLFDVIETSHKWVADIPVKSMPAIKKDKTQEEVERNEIGQHDGMSWAVFDVLMFCNRMIMKNLYSL